MSKRRRKVLLIGAKGYERTDESLRVDCLLWTKLSSLPNIRDYDDLILDLLPLKTKRTRDEVDWTAFDQLLNFHSTMDILMNGGMIIVIGDPRFKIKVKVGKTESQKEKIVEHSFMGWTGINFFWDPEPGDTITFTDNYSHRHYADYIAKLHKWTYSMAGCSFDKDTIASRFNLNYIHEHGNELHLDMDDFCCNRYKNALAVKLYYQHRDREHKQVHQAFGPITLLPEISVSEDETLQLVLTNICGIETNLPEPEWIAQYIAPGQKTIDDEITRVNSDIESKLDELSLAMARREECRKCLKLLYEREYALEPVVRDILRGLGAHVEDPAEKNKEDGWIVVTVGESTYEGVLEIKSTRSKTFGEEGRKQLLDWIDRGRTLRERNYKGIFIGNSAVDMPEKERPWAFSDSWTKAAELSQICVFKTENLYVFHLLNARGKLDLDAFWTDVFQTNGVLNMKKYWDALAPKEI